MKRGRGSKEQGIAVFAGLFFKRAAICMIVFGVMLYALLTCRFYGSTDRLVKENESYCNTVLSGIEQTLAEHTYEEAAGEVAFRLAALRTIWHPAGQDKFGDYMAWTGKSYGCWIDAATGEVLADTEGQGFLVLRQKDTETESEDLRVFQCPFEDVAEVYRRVYGNGADSAGETEKVFLAGGTYRTARVLDMYVNGSRFKPGRVQIDEILVNPGRGADLHVQETVVGREILDLSDTAAGENGPGEQEDGYVYREIDPEEFVTFMIVDDRERTDGERERAASQFRRLDRNGGGYLFGRENNGVLAFCSGRIWCAASRAFTDRTGQEYLLNFYCEYPALFGDDLKMLRKTAAACCLTAFFAAVVWTVAAFRTLKNRNAMETYRRTLMDSMAHDLKSPLTVIGGYAENLKLNAHEEKRDRYIDGITENVCYMKDIIEKNLELFREERNERPIKKTALEGVAICRELFSRYESDVSKKELSVSLEGSFPFKGDRELFGRAMDNLVTNCIRYTPQKGKIRVVGKKYALIVQNDAHLSYRGRIRRLWEPFVTGDESRGGRHGTGLGLSIAHNIFRCHGLLHYLRYDKRKGMFECILVKKK